MPARTLLAIFALALCASPSLAANARHPHQNINPRVDAGNDTGDAQVEELNRRQLDENYYGYGRSPEPYYAPQRHYPAPGYYPPPPDYVQPPPYWR